MTSTGKIQKVKLRAQAAPPGRRPRPAECRLSPRAGNWTFRRGLLHPDQRGASAAVPRRLGTRRCSAMGEPIRLLVVSDDDPGVDVTV